MNDYKGIKRSDSPKIWNFIDTYYNIAREDYYKFLDSDVCLQKLVERYYLKRKVLIVLFNLSFYIIPYTVYKGIS